VEPVVRSARAQDVPAIAGLYLEVAEEVVGREPSFRHVPDAASVESRYLSRIEEADRAVLVALADGAVVGFVDAALQRHEDQGTHHAPGLDAYVEELVVTARHRRRGVATALIRAVEARAREAGARMVWLDTHLRNEGARALYGTIGYREVGVILLRELRARQNDGNQRQQ
jgi:ribosomal protein S18 acetylase RimI-like enzyme